MPGRRRRVFLEQLQKLEDLIRYRTVCPESVRARTDQRIRNARYALLRIGGMSIGDRDAVTPESEVGHGR